MKRETLLVVCAIGTLLIGAILWPIWDDSVLAVSARWVAITLVVAGLILWVSPKFGLPGSFAERVQTLSAFFTAFAIVVAAVVYFLERRDQTKLVTSLDIHVVRPTSGDEPVKYVLLAVRAPVENKGNRIVQIECMGIDVLVPAPGDQLQRSSSYLEEMQLQQLGEQIAYDTKTTRQCVQAAEQRRHAAPGSMRPLFMWPVLKLEPSEQDDQYFEIPVSCKYPFVRVIWKMRVKPQDIFSIETKATVSLWDACRGEIGVTSATVQPTIQTEAAGSAEPAKTR
jgi:hypothetical protein